MWTEGDPSHFFWGQSFWGAGQEVDELLSQLPGRDAAEPSLFPLSWEEPGSVFCKVINPLFILF